MRDSFAAGRKGAEQAADAQRVALRIDERAQRAAPGELILANGQKAAVSMRLHSKRHTQLAIRIRRDLRRQAHAAIQVNKHAAGKRARRQREHRHIAAKIGARALNKRPGGHGARGDG